MSNQNPISNPTAASSAESVPSKGGAHAKYTILRGKQNLFEAIRDAKAHISAAFRLPSMEIETGVEETQSSFLKRIIIENPRERLKDPAANCLTEEQREEVDSIRETEDLDAEERAAAAEAIETVYLEMNLEELTIANEAIGYQNDAIKELIKEEAKDRKTLPDRRKDASRWMMEHWMTVEVRRAVEDDPGFHPVYAVDFSTPFEIFKICKILFSDQTTINKSVRQYHAQTELTAIKQTSADEYVQFCTRFSDAVTALKGEGGTPEDELLICIYVNALDSKLFYQIKEDFKVPHKKLAYPKEWQAFKRETNAIFYEYQRSGTTSKDLDHLLVLKASVSDNEEKPTCSCCCKRHFGECHNVEAIKELFEGRLKAATAAKERFDARHAPREKKAVRCVKIRAPNAGDESVKVIAYEDLKQQGVRADEIDFIFDCAAEAGLTADPSICINPSPVSLIIEGAIPGETMRAVVKMEFLHGLGRPLVAGNRNVISDYEAAANYKREYVGLHHVLLSRKDDPTCTWDFIRDPGRYGDLFYHCTMAKKEYLLKGARDDLGKQENGSVDARDHS